MTAVDAELAQGYLLALNEFEGQEAARSELRSAGVSERRIQALYPLDFDSIAGGIRSILRPSVLKGLKSSKRRDTLRSRHLQGAYITRTAGVKSQWSADYDNYFNPLFAPQRHAGFEELDQFIARHFESTTQGALLRRRILEVTFDAWWLMAHRNQLGDMQTEADQLMIWMAQTLLPDLKARGSRRIVILSDLKPIP